MIIRAASTSINAQGQELVGHGTAIFPLDCYEENVSATPVLWHWHEDWEIVLATQGMLQVKTTPGDLTLQPGEAVFFGPGCVHEITGGAPDSMLRSAVFHPRLISSMDSVIWQKYVQPLQEVGAVGWGQTLPWHKQCIALFSACWAALEQEPVGFELLAREALSQLALLLCTQLDLKQKKLSLKAAQDSLRIKEMLQFIQAHYGEEITSAQIAASAMLSESQCLRCFRSTIHTTPGQYLKEYRLQAACQLLTTTGEKVGEIGAVCGFLDAAYFTKLFRETLGCTPAAYRLAQKERGM